MATPSRRHTTPMAASVLRMKTAPTATQAELTLAAMWVVCRRDGVAMRDFLVPMIRPVVAGIAMFAGVAAVRASLVVEAPAMQLVTEIGAGAAIYIGLAWLIARSSCDELVRAVRLVMTTS